MTPYQALAPRLLAHVDGGDGSHDTSHLDRVWNNARAIMAGEGGDAELLAAAVLLHDCVQVEKSSPLRARASRLAAERGRGWRGSGCAGWPGSSRRSRPRSGWRQVAPGRRWRHVEGARPVGARLR
jgi:uncharacterized protein